MLRLLFPFCPQGDLQEKSLEQLCLPDRSSLLSEIQALRAQLRMVHLQNQEKLQHLRTALTSAEARGSQQEHQLRKQGGCPCRHCLWGPASAPAHLRLTCVALGAEGGDRASSGQAPECCRGSQLIELSRKDPGDRQHPVGPAQRPHCWAWCGQEEPGLGSECWQILGSLH